MNVETKFIVLRGPSASGKSTIAEQLQKLNQKETIIIEQDYYRFTILKGREDTKAIAAKMSHQDMIIALENGFDVIADGIFPLQRYKKIFDDILKVHPDNNYIFYFDISFDETVKRHASRPKADHFTPEEMKEWYYAAEPLGYDFEHKVPEEWKLQQTVEFIQDKTGL